MTETPPPSPAPDAAGGGAGLLWTAALGVSLIAIALAPRRSVRDEAPPEDVRDTPAARPRPKDGARSYAGRAAHWVAETQGERGRHARSPGEITASGWKDIALRVFQEFQKDRVLSVAAGVTFYALLALFPAIAALVSLYGLVADVATINEHLSAMQGVLPSGAIDIVGEQVKRISAKGGGTLSFSFFTSLIISLWSANAGMKAMFEALNIVYEEEEKRSFVMLNLRSLAFTAAALVFVILALLGIVVLPIVLNFLGIGEGGWMIAAVRWPVLLGVLLSGLAALYRFGPSRDAPRWGWVTWGSVMAGLLWLVASIGFSWYVSGFGNYNQTYGSLGAVIGFMTWIWISTTIVLLGGEVNAEMEHQTAHDTTAGPAEPMGVRRARMADTIGAPA